MPTPSSSARPTRQPQNAYFTPGSCMPSCARACAAAVRWRTCSCCCAAWQRSTSRTGARARSTAVQHRLGRSRAARNTMHLHNGTHSRGDRKAARTSGCHARCAPLPFDPPCRDPCARYAGYRRPRGLVLERGARRTSTLPAQARASQCMRLSSISISSWYSTRAHTCTWAGQGSALEHEHTRTLARGQGRSRLLPQH